MLRINEISDKCTADLVKAGFIDEGDIATFHVVRKRNFYPKYDQQYTDKMEVVTDQFKSIKNLLLTGRIGMYNYNNSGHCADMGRFIAENLVAHKTPNQILDELHERVRNYKVVD